LSAKKIFKNITDYYKNLFGRPDESTIKLKAGHATQIQPFSYLSRGIDFFYFKMEHNNAPGLMVSGLIFINIAGK
jgi:hypothetical protein